MIIRGNLTKCIQGAMTAFSYQAYPMLSILHNPTGNYYTVVTEEELEKFGDSRKDSIHRLLFRGTYRELIRFTTTKQIDLFEGEKSDAPQNADEAETDIQVDDSV